jgi:hypothetical protein
LQIAKNCDLEYEKITFRFNDFKPFNKIVEEAKQYYLSEDGDGKSAVSDESVKKSV